MNTKPALVASPIAVTIALLAVSSPARADGTHPQNALQNETQNDAETRRRIEVLQRHLDKGETYATYWFWGWAAGFAAISGVNTTLALTTNDPEARKESTLAAISSGLGLISTLALPPTAAFAPARIRAMPDATPEQRAAKLAAAKKALETAAWEEKFGSSWLPHVATAVVNTTSFAIRLLVFRHNTLAYAAIGPSLAIGEGKILTMPSAAMDAQRDYQRSFAAPSAGARLAPTVLDFTFTF